MLKLLVLLGLFGAASALLGRTQSAAVRGKLMCNGEPAGGVLVKLYDDDRGIDTDDLMAEGKTDGNGEFILSGHTDEFTTIDPKVNVYHDCEDGIMPCQRKISIMIPDKYVTNGKVSASAKDTQPKDTYDAGTIQLAGKFKGEERDCIHRA